VTLVGRLYGQGPRAVIFSNMNGDIQASWDPIVPEIASRDVMVLTYNQRGVRGSQGQRSFEGSVPDLRAAVAFAREQGATELILIGASLGGMATAKVAATEQVAGVVILSSPTSADGCARAADQ
jgi:alpha/beta superfamily hydrolase